MRYELTINPGSAEALRDIAKQMTAVNSKGEPDTLLYDVYINEEKSLLTFWHTQKDSDALLFHADRFSKGDFVSHKGNRDICAALLYLLGNGLFWLESVEGVRSRSTY